MGTKWLLHLKTSSLSQAGERQRAEIWHQKTSPYILLVRAMVYCFASSKADQELWFLAFPSSIIEVSKEDVLCELTTGSAIYSNVAKEGWDDLECFGRGPMDFEQEGKD